MKNLIKISLALSFIFIISSCEDLLVEEPLGLVTAENHYSTVEGLDHGVKAAYSHLRGFYGTEAAMFMTVPGTDLWTNGFGGHTNHPILGTYSPNLSGTDYFITPIWNALYEGINQCNTIVNRAGNVTGNQSEVDEIVAQARFLRALYYFHLVRQYGDVHFTLEETQGVETEARRTPVATIYEDGIVPDLQYAIDNLSETTEEYGRVTKPAAEALMARVQLTLGNWSLAEEHAVRVIDNYDFELVKPYIDLWDINNQVNSEVILAAQYETDVRISQDTNINHVLFVNHYFYNPALEFDLEYGRGHNRFSPTNKLIKLFDISKDGRWEGSFKTLWLANTTGEINGHTVTPGDTAMYVVPYPVSDEIQETAPYWYFDFNDNWVGDRTYECLEIGCGLRRWWPSLRKHYDPWRSDPLATRGTRDVVIIRLAEMYLIAAEAAYQQGNSESAADFINVIRRRAAIEGKEAEMEVTAADINLDFILDERGRELAGEGHRWYDLKRTGKLLEQVKLYNPDAAVNIQPHHLVRPIPQTQIDRVSNPGDFPQNPGY